ncbi:hypothetical protein [Methanobrevibacter sp.]|uniref:hypothetical protein n=1 Tax=Methanobrevibacter sp. TaxID=66852 RepID=UPI00388D37D8
MIVLTEDNHLYVGYEEYEYRGDIRIRVEEFEIPKKIVVAWQPIWLPREFVWNEIVRSLKLTINEQERYKIVFEKLMSTRDKESL